MGGVGEAVAAMEAGRRPWARAQAPGSAPLTPADLAELMRAFNEVTGKLHDSHERLQGEVERLRRELREANEQLQRSRRLAAMGEMAAGIAHEVRNPLGSISLYARMLEEDLAQRPEQCELAVKIGEAVRGLDAIVRDVLGFARELKLRAQPLDAAGALRRAAEAVLAGVGADVEVRWLEGPMVALRGDRDLVHQALLNVVRNAVEAMEAAERRVLTLGAARVEDPEAGERVALLVEDTGGGIAPEVIDRMFNPFFTTRASGTGLGLAIVHRIVDAHGGRVVVKSEPAARRGTRVELQFPPASAQDAPGESHTQVVVRRPKFAERAA